MSSDPPCRTVPRKPSQSGCIPSFASLGFRGRHNSMNTAWSRRATHANPHISWGPGHRPPGSRQAPYRGASHYRTPRNQISNGPGNPAGPETLWENSPQTSVRSMFSPPCLSRLCVCVLCTCGIILLWFIELWERFCILKINFPIRALYRWWGIFRLSFHTAAADLRACRSFLEYTHTTLQFAELPIIRRGNCNKLILWWFPARAVWCISGGCLLFFAGIS